MIANNGTCLSQLCLCAVNGVSGVRRFLDFCEGDLRRDRLSGLSVEYSSGTTRFPLSHSEQME